MPGGAQSQPCLVCGGSVPGGADACPACGARLNAGQRKQFVLYDPSAETGDSAGGVATEPSDAWSSLTAAIPEEVWETEAPARPQGDGTLDLTDAAAEAASLEQTAILKRGADSARLKGLRRFAREDGPRWNPLTWVARLEGWAIRRQIRHGMRYARTYKGVDVVELDARGFRAAMKLHRPEMNPFAVAFAGLIPGVGNLWLRQPFRAAALGIPGLILLIAVLARWTSPDANLWTLALAATMVLSYDYTAKNYRKLRDEEYDFSHRFQMLLLLGLAGGALLGVLRAAPFVWGFAAPTTKLKPYLAKGEFAIFNKWPASLGGPQRGDVVLYRPARFAFFDAKGRSGNVQEAWRIGRVTATEGDTVEVRQGGLWINGTAVAQGEGLFGRITAPEDMPPRVLKRGEVWIPYDNIQSDNAIVAYSGNEAGPAEWDGIPRGGSVIMSTWVEACVVKQSQIIGVLEFVLFPPENRRRLE